MCDDLITSQTVQQRVTLLCSLQLCRECFYDVFEQEVHQSIIDNKLFKSGEKVAIGASGMLNQLCHPTSVCFPSVLT